MKMARKLTAWAVIYAVTSAVSFADPATANPSAPSSTDSDPDGVPDFVSRQQRQLTPDQIEAIQKEQEQMEKDKNWLLNGYKERMQSRAAREAQDKQDADNSFLSRKNQSQLSGLYDDAAGSQQGKLNLRTGTTSRSGLTLRDAPSPSSAKSSYPSAFSFQPLISGQGATAGSGWHNVYSPLSSSTRHLLPSTSTNRTSPRSSDDLAKDPAAMETPGLTAAQGDPLSDNTSLAFDIPANDLPSRPDSSPNAPTQLELPLTTNVERLQKHDQLYLNTPGSIKSTTATPTIKAPPLEFYNEVFPDRVPQPSPVRQPIANPLDIPYH